MIKGKLSLDLRAVKRRVFQQRRTYFTAVRVFVRTYTSLCNREDGLLQTLHFEERRKGVGHFSLHGKFPLHLQFLIKLEQGLAEIRIKSNQNLQQLQRRKSRYELRSGKWAKLTFSNLKVYLDVGLILIIWFLKISLELETRMTPTS